MGDKVNVSVLATKIDFLRELNEKQDVEILDLNRKVDRLQRSMDDHAAKLDTAFISERGANNTAHVQLRAGIGTVGQGLTDHLGSHARDTGTGRFAITTTVAVVAAVIAAAGVAAWVH